MKRPSKLLYQTNKLAYAAMMFHIIAVTIYLVIVLLNMTINWRIAVVSLSNVILMLFAFLVAVKIKVYDSKFQFIPLLLAAYQLYQGLVLPQGVAGNAQFIALTSAFAAAGFAIMASLVSIHRNKIRKQVIKTYNITSNQLSK